MIALLAACGGAPEPARVKNAHPNVLLVSLDTLRADHVGAYGYARDTTPVLDALAAEGTRFDLALSQANESAWSHAALLTGRYASELASPVYATYAIPNDVTLVSEALSAYGYATAAFSAGGHVTADFGYDQGWDHWSAERGFGSLFATGPKASEWVAKVPAGQPWFAFLHGYDAHRPYHRPGPWNHLYSGGEGSPLAEALCKNPCISEMVLGDALLLDVVPSWFSHAGGDSILDPMSYTRLAAAAPDARRIAVTAADKQHVQDHYDGAVRYGDTMLGLTLQRLRALGALDDTVVVVLSDHGEDLLDHGYMNHRTGLFDSCTRVPLVAWGPGFNGGTVAPGLVDGRDVAATILSVAGALPPAGSGGRDLRAVARGELGVDAVFSEGVMDMLSVRTMTHRLVAKDSSLVDPALADRLAAEPLDSKRFELYDLRSDPGEHTDVHRQDPATMEALRTRLVAWRRSITVGQNVLPQDQVSPEVAAELRKHGYWDVPGGQPAAPTVDPTPGIDASPPAAGASILRPYRDAACNERFQFAPP
ncbi:MAG: hypothetical protein EXR71_14830 [Myxococcales bacterium]|nr:hypothetical protein [Myxococcales bacterium]